MCLSQRFVTAYYKIRLSVDESTTASFMSELLKLRDNYLYFSNTFPLDQSDIATLIMFKALFAYALVCLAVCTLYVLWYDNFNNNNADLYEIE